jgi:hypothetical protein
MSKEIGDLDDGGVYVGASATTGEDLHCARADEPAFLTYAEAVAAALEMRRIPGRENAHLPTLEELELNLFANRNRGALKGTFNEKAAFDYEYPESAPYRSSEVYAEVDPNSKKPMAWTIWFNDGFKDLANGELDARLPVRLVW